MRPWKKHSMSEPFISKPWIYDGICMGWLGRKKSDDGKLDLPRNRRADMLATVQI